MWRIKINVTKSVQVTFTLRKEQCPVVHINNTVISKSPTAKFLGLHLDSKLTWAQHLAKERKQIDLKVKDLYWVTGRKSPASLQSKILYIQDNRKAYLDLWNRIMGMRQQIAYSQNATKPVQNTADDQKCAMVCD
jgi:NADH:ubiquinone oxidoreductase subunit D